MIPTFGIVFEIVRSCDGVVLCVLFFLEMSLWSFKETLIYVKSAMGARRKRGVGKERIGFRSGNAD